MKSIADLNFQSIYNLLKNIGFLIKIITINIYKLNEIDNDSYLRLTIFGK